MPQLRDSGTRSDPARTGRTIRRDGRVLPYFRRRNQIRPWRCTGAERPVDAGQVAMTMFNPSSRAPLRNTYLTNGSRLYLEPVGSTPNTPPKRARPARGPGPRTSPANT